MEENNEKRGNFIRRTISYIFVAAVASALTLFIYGSRQTNEFPKLRELKMLLDQRFIGQIDEDYMNDVMASGMVASLDDQWSFYIPADQYQLYEEQHTNSYVGIGVTIQVLENDAGFSVQQVEPNGPAKEGGILPGDVIIGVDGKKVTELGSDAAQNMIAGQEGTKVSITVLRDGQEITMELERRSILMEVASGKMLTDTVGYIQISNFNERCAQETLAIFADLEAQGAKAMIFDVRFNPGGYVSEMVEVLDFLLPEGVLFQTEDYAGRTEKQTSDPACKDIPMAVLINGDSVSAAEFFAAALTEYEYAITVGQPTLGKGYFQQSFVLSDGSAVNLSVGKYFTPKGKSLAEEGGLQPDIFVDADEEMMAKIYSETIAPEEDTQLQTALAALQKEIS